MADEYSGTARATSGQTLTIGALSFRLHGVSAPPLGTDCVRAGRHFDCGVVAQSQLSDFTLGAVVRCLTLASVKAEDPPFARCAANEYDLSNGMIYTGWARADAKQSSAYNDTEQKARIAGRGMWSSDIVVPAGWR